MYTKALSYTENLARSCSDCEILTGMSVEIEECSSSAERLVESEEMTTEILLKESRLKYSKEFLLSMSNLQNCKDLPKDFDQSILHESRLMHSENFMLSMSNLQMQNCKDLPKDFDQSVSRESRLMYTTAFILSLSNLQICKDLPKDFDPSILLELDDASECKLGMQRTSAILPPYASNNHYIGSSTVVRCDLDADSRGSCGRWEKQVPRSNTESTSQGSCDSDSRVQSDFSGILGSILNKSKNPYRPPQSYKVGNSNSYASHPSKETKYLANTSCTAQEQVQLVNGTLQDDIRVGKSSDVLATHWSKQITNLSEGQKAVDKFVEDKSQCKALDSMNGAIATSQEEQLLDSDAKALVASINPEESEKQQSGKILEKEVSVPYTDFPGSEERCLMGLCTARPKNDIPVNILTEGRDENLKLNLELKEDFETEISNGLLSGEAFFPSQGNSDEWISKINQLEPSEIFLAPVLRHCGAIGTDDEGIRRSIFDCELEIDEIEESTSPFDYFWTEILAVVHLEQESNVNYSDDTVNKIDFEIPPSLPDEDELILLKSQEGPKEPKIPPVDTSTDLEFVEDEINLPDEDSLISVDDLTKHMVKRNVWETYTADSVDNFIDAYCSEATYSGRTDTLMPNFTADNTEQQKVTHCYEESFPPSLEVPPSPELSSGATHQKPGPKQTLSQIPCFHATPEILTLHPLDLYFTCPRFQNFREQKLVHYYPAVCWYPLSNIHHESSMKTTPPKEKKYEYLEQYQPLHQPDYFALQQKGLSPADLIQQVVYDIQEWDTMQLSPETYQPSHYPGLEFPI